MLSYKRTCYCSQSKIIFFNRFTCSLNILLVSNNLNMLVEVIEKLMNIKDKSHDIVKLINY